MVDSVSEYSLICPPLLPSCITISLAFYLFIPSPCAPSLPLYLALTLRFQTIISSLAPSGITRHPLPPPATPCHPYLTQVSRGGPVVTASGSGYTESSWENYPNTKSHISPPFNTHRHPIPSHTTQGHAYSHIPHTVMHYGGR